MSDIEITLKERDTRYGSYVEQARISQNMKRAMSESPNWRGLAPYQRDSLENIALKISRILSGDPNYFDNWHDIQGYAKLAADQVGLDEAVGK